MSQADHKSDKSDKKSDKKDRADKSDKKEPKAAADPAAVKTEPKKARSGGKREKGVVLSCPISPEGETRISPAYRPRLEKLYKEQVIARLMKEFKYKNPMQVPRLTKVTINCTMKDAVANPKILDNVIDEILYITGQRPVLTKAKKSVASFKVREGNRLGAMVTLRRARMW